MDDPSAVWVLIPARPPHEAKSRLASALDAKGRERLARAILAHVVETALATSNIDRTCLVAEARFGMNTAVTLLHDPGMGLNLALQSALREADRAGATRVVILPGDLAQLTIADIEQLALARRDSALIAPDRHGSGTNGLSLPLPAASEFTFAFGPGSRALHHAEAQRLGLSVHTINSPGLARDIDEPADLPDAILLFP